MIFIDKPPRIRISPDDSRYKPRSINETQSETTNTFSRTWGLEMSRSYKIPDQKKNRILITTRVSDPTIEMSRQVNATIYNTTTFKNRFIDKPATYDIIPLEENILPISNNVLVEVDVDEPTDTNKTTDTSSSNSSNSSFKPRFNHQTFNSILPQKVKPSIMDTPISRSNNLPFKSDKEINKLLNSHQWWHKKTQKEKDI